MSLKYLITGGAGFIGSNYVDRLIGRGQRVVIYDNLSRRGAQKNLDWLSEKHGTDSYQLVVGDVRDASLLTQTARDVDIIFHLASQVAVTTSVLHPREDFEINALGTLNVLEAARFADKNPPVMYASTNKVYGGMETEELVEEKTRYRYQNLPNGVSETYPLDFHSPYGCSKGAGDQYTRDYFRIYNVPTVVFRQSCIYGKRQFGIEDQGWLAWFVIAALTGKPITIYGNGKQVRDALYVDDLLDIYDLALANMDKAKGQVFNVGGGMDNTISIWQEFGPLLETLMRKTIAIERNDWRPGDQHIYISDNALAEKLLGWKPKTPINQGVKILYNWIRENLSLIE